MAIINYRQFKGEIPGIEPHLLPGSNAQLARNCEFTRGALTSTRGGALLSEMASNPVKGIYTQDGLLFYTWDSETLAFRTPIISDAFNRMYFLRLSEGVLRVTSTLNMANSGPTPLPGNTYRTGVPRPTVAPTLSLVDRTTLPDYPSATVRFDAWLEYNGKTYDKAENTTFVTTTPFKAYTITRPVKTEGTPDEATLAIKMVIKEGDTEILNIMVRPGVTVRSQSLPGTQEFNLADSTPPALTITWGPEDTRAYVYVNQNEWNEEGAPSPPATISPTYLQDVVVGVSASDFTGYNPFLRYNIYRTFGVSTTYVGIDYSGTFPNFIDGSRLPSAVKGALESTDWDPAPEGLQGAAYMTGGIMAVFKGTELFVSDPYRPHAFPYIFSFQASIRGICAAQQTLVITTADGIFILAGTSPSTARPVKLAMPQPGIAQRSMVNVDGGVVYASTDGLVMIDGSVASMELSQRLFGRRQWLAIFGEILRDRSLRLSFQDGRLIASSDNYPLGFVLRFDEDVGSLSRTDERYDSAFRLPIDDALFYSIGRSVYRFQAGSEKIFDWHGKDFIFPKYEKFGAVFLRGDPVALTIYCDGLQVYSKTISAGVTRLPSRMPKCLRMSVRIRGTGSVFELTLAGTVSELKSV